MKSNKRIAEECVRRLENEGLLDDQSLNATVDAVVVIKDIINEATAPLEQLIKELEGELKEARMKQFSMASKTETLEKVAKEILMHVPRDARLILREKIDDDMIYMRILGLIKKGLSDG